MCEFKRLASNHHYVYTNDRINSHFPGQPETTGEKTSRKFLYVAEAVIVTYRGPIYQKSVYIEKLLSKENFPVCHDLDVFCKSGTRGKYDQRTVTIK